MASYQSQRDYISWFFDQVGGATRPTASKEHMETAIFPEYLRQAMEEFPAATAEYQLYHQELYVWRWLCKFKFSIIFILQGANSP
jgi:hypothetical protein